MTDINISNDNIIPINNNNRTYFIPQENIKQDNIKPIIQSVMIPANLQVPFKVKNVYNSKTLTTNTRIDIVV